MLAGFGFIGLLAAQILAGTNPAGRDFIEYWAAAQQLAHGASPYDQAGMLQVEQAVGFGLARPEMWYSPPPNLLFALPLGWVNAPLGLVLWIMAQFACFAASIWLMWKTLGRPNSLLFLAAFLFPPALLCIQAGQISLFFTLGMALFLFLHQRHPFLAGVALLPCALKPHLFFAFAVALLVWSTWRRVWTVVAGWTLAFAAATGLVWLLDHDAWAQYRAMMQSEGMLHEFTARLSSALRFAVAPEAAWVQFVPAALACVWAAWFAWTRRERWDWLREGQLVLLVSVLCAAYGWLFDEAVLMPAMLVALWRAREARWKLALLGLAVAACLYQMHAGANLMTHAYLWTAPVWLGWYLLAVSGYSDKNAELGGAE